MKKKILALTTINNTIALGKAVANIKENYGDLVEVKKIYFDEFENPEVSLNPIEKEIQTSDIILVDIRGDVRVGRELPKMLEGVDKTIVVLIGGAHHIFALTKMGKFKGEMIFKPGREKEFDIHSYMKTKKFSKLTKILGKMLPFGMLKDMKNWILAQEYYAEGDAENLKNLILFLLKNYGGIKDIKSVPPPKKQISFGLYAPGVGIFKDLEKYKKEMKFNDEKPTIGLLLYGGMHFEDTRLIADALNEYLKDKVNFIMAFAEVEYNLEVVYRYFNDLDILVNVQYFRIHGGPYGGEPEPTYELLERLDVPVIIGLRSFETEIETWKESKQGLNPLEIALGVTLPELDGGIQPIFLAGLDALDDPNLGRVKGMTVLQDRIEKLGRVILKWTALRRIPNKEKRLAIVTYNYPPGEENLASAGYLDVFKSLELFLLKLKERGYSVAIPEMSLKELFLSSGIVNTPGYIQKTKLKVPVEEYVSWFKTLPNRVQDEVVHHWGEPPGTIMVEGNDLLIPGVILGNVFLGVQPSRGTHEDIDKAYHDKDLPPHHQYLAFYFFLEKMFQADALLHFGMHGTLEFTKGKEIALSSECFPDILIGDLPHVYYYWIGNTSESTIAKRRSYALCISHASPPMKSSGLYEKYVILDGLLSQYDENKDEKTLDLIHETAKELNLLLDVPELKKELYRMKRRLIPHGLHVLDRVFTKEELVDYLIGVLRIDRNYPSIIKLVAEHEGHEAQKIDDPKVLEKLEDLSRKIIEQILDGGQVKWLPRGYEEFVREIARNANGSTESENLFRALEGKYIFPTRGGDPIRDPDVYPSGRAMYAFDPRLIPTVLAEIRGRRAAELLLKQYSETSGKYPESVGIVLWGFETMKTGGDTIATILSLLGVKIKHLKSPWFKELEVIPLEELKRPRIDVVITICGIFRDTFRTHVDLLNRAVKMVGKLDEPVEMNYIRKHYLEMKDELKDSALARIFGPSATEYATSMRTLIESGAWNEEKDLVKSYDDSMNHAYFNGRVEKNEKAFSQNLKHVDLVVQERDNTEYEVTDLDHYYEFLGGLSRSVQEKRQKSAEVMVIDSTEEEVVVEDLKISIERATRTRTLNPVWIEGMLKHDFHGVKKIKDRVEYLLGLAATTGKVENW
ncbi:MAG: cobaltochelatase subunit CobN, partial [Candidatus Helarchaeales archaeon]